ncbi:DUF5763 domain-containing protein [Thalassotalea sp. ND16A]|uniref:DUF5763 domain-containing protein n=1 Tax=Thalassotalea sp. ND16A TaxID=1535422 RepID=UPI00051A89E9|nr:DUF5763 domain-containing protein [Thalassotalea sp. ND16A]KGJ98135.1 hypothetical protein ND16A_0940 [Thalassotalea sp. ND16A]
MSDNQDLPLYTESNQCKWEKDKMRCNNKASKDGYCEKHYQARGTNIMGGSVGAVVLASLLTANPLALIGAAVVGGLLGSKNNETEHKNG